MLYIRSPEFIHLAFLRLRTHQLITLYFPYPPYPYHKSTSYDSNLYGFDYCNFLHLELSKYILHYGFYVSPKFHVL